MSVWLTENQSGVDYNAVGALINHFPFHDWVGKYGSFFRVMNKKYLIGVITQTDQIFIIENTRGLKIMEKIDLDKTKQSIIRAKQIINKYL